MTESQFQNGEGLKDDTIIIEGTYAKIYYSRSCSHFDDAALRNGAESRDI